MHDGHAGLGVAARRYGDRAIAVSQQFDDEWVKGQCFNYRGIGLYASARYEEGLEHLNKAVSAFENAGDLWELNLARFHRACCHFGLGNLAGAIDEARWVFDASARLGDSRTLCSSYLWARAARGDVPFEEMKSCYPSRPDDVMSTVHGVMAEGHWHTFHGRTAEAVRSFEQAGEIARKHFCLNSHTIMFLPELAGALRRHADHLQATDRSQGDRLRRRAYRLARWSARITRLFPAAHPFALRELGLLLAEQGKYAQAMRALGRSCAAALDQKAKYQHAQSLLARGKIASQLGKAEGEEQIRTAQAALDAIERPIARPASRRPSSS